MSSPNRPRSPIAPPKFVGVPKDTDDPVVARYRDGIVERAKGAGSQHKVPVPNLLAASQDYKPGKDGPMTLGQMAISQENIRAMDKPAPSHTFKPETLAGLKALHDQAVSQQQAVAEKISQSSDSSGPTPVAAAEPEKKSVTKISEEERRELAEQSDVDFDLMMSRLRTDVISNDTERKAIEARLKPMDLTDGLLSGEWKQHVPIHPGKLEVVFRTITPLENEEIRRKVLENVLADERQARFAADQLGFMQTVAAIHSINGGELPSHLAAGDKGVGRKFMWDVFQRKYDTFMAYPGPLIQALATHAHWFDLRVRGLFTSTALKNG